MNAVYTPEWDHLATELIALRTRARRDVQVHGRVLPDTQHRLDEACDRVEATVAIDEAKRRGIVTRRRHSLAALAAAHAEDASAAAWEAWLAGVPLSWLPRGAQ